MEQENAGSPQAPATQVPAQDDNIKNLKAEMNRKLDNTNAQLQAVLEQLKAASAKPAPAPTPAEPKKAVSVFEDEAAFARQIKEETQAELRAEMARQQQAMAKQQSTLASLVSEFPELSSNDSELTKKAVELYNGYGEDEKLSPIAYKAAVKEAALELGIKPKSKRNAPDEDESFSMGAGGSNGASKKQKEDVDVRTLAFAEACGLTMTPELKERLKKRATRKSYSKWSQ